MACNVRKYWQFKPGSRLTKKWGDAVKRERRREGMTHGKFLITVLAIPIITLVLPIAAIADISVDVECTCTDNDRVCKV